MRTRTTLQLLPALLFAGLAAFSAPTARPDDTPLGAHMEEIDGAMKRLRRAVGDEAKRGECLELVAELQRAAVEAKSGVPKKTETQPEAERAAFAAAYRRTMVELLQKSCELELALLDGDQEAIDTAFKQLRAMEDTGHERFTDDG